MFSERYLNGYALCRQPLLASEDCRLGALVLPFWQEHLSKPFWHLGSTLGGHFGTSGPPWKTMGAAGWTRGCIKQDFCRFGNDCGRCLCQFFEFRIGKKSCLFRLVSRSYFYRLLPRNVDVWDFQIVVFAKRTLKKRLFMEVLFNEFRGGFYSFWKALWAVFLLLFALKTDLKTKGFLWWERILLIGSDGADRGGMWAFERHKSIAW